MRLHSWDQPTLVVKHRSKNPFGLINIVNKVVIELLLLFVVTAAGEVLDGEENKEKEQTRKINRKIRKDRKEGMKATPETRPRSNAMAIGAEPTRNRSNAITKKKFKGEQNANEKSAAKQGAAAKISITATNTRALPETEQGMAGLGKPREF